MDVKCTSKVEAEPGDYLTAGLVKAWAADLPPDATVSHLTRDLGSQRDPYVVLVGLRAAWTETR